MILNLNLNLNLNRNLDLNLISIWQDLESVADGRLCALTQARSLGPCAQRHACHGDESHHVRYQLRRVDQHAEHQPTHNRSKKRQ